MRFRESVAPALVLVFATGCFSRSQPPAYYQATQSDIVNATARAFEHAELPISEVTTNVVRTAEFQATTVWSIEQVRERMSCGVMLQRARIESATLSMWATISEDPSRTYPATRVMHINDTSVRLGAKGEMVVNGSKVRCTITPEFADMMIMQIGAAAGVPPRRTPATNRPEQPRLPGIPGETGRGGR